MSSGGGRWHDREQLDAVTRESVRTDVRTSGWFNREGAASAQ
jgi:hypothetical protein